MRKKLGAAFYLATVALSLAVAFWLTFNTPPLKVRPAAVGSLDLRKDRSVEHYSIVLKADRGGLAGHASVMWSKHISNDEFGFETLGFYMNGMGGVLLDESDLERDSPTNVLVVRVDESDYRKTLALAKSWSQNGTYRLLGRDCVTFVAAVATTLGIETPPRKLYFFPADYVSGLIEVNFRWSLV